MEPQPLGVGVASHTNAGALGFVERRVPAPRRPKASPRPVPQRRDALAHLSLDGLRECRTALSKEESQVSYWRRIIQARLDVVREGRLGVVDDAHLRPVLTDARVGSGRSALVEVLQVDDLPPLPSLADLWDRTLQAGDASAADRLEADLHTAEQQLSYYRQALHRRIGEATGELIARYREQPGLCLSALPLRAQRSHVTA